MAIRLRLRLANATTVIRQLVRLKLEYLLRFFERCQLNYHRLVGLAELRLIVNVRYRCIFFALVWQYLKPIPGHICFLD